MECGRRSRVFPLEFFRQTVDKESRFSTGAFRRLSREDYDFFLGAIDVVAEMYCLGRPFFFRIFRFSLQFLRVFFFFNSFSFFVSFLLPFLFFCLCCGLPGGVLTGGRRRFLWNARLSGLAVSFI